MGKKATPGKYDPQTAPRKSPRRENLAKWGEADLGEDIGAWTMKKLTDFLQTNVELLPNGDTADTEGNPFHNRCRTRLHQSRPELRSCSEPDYPLGLTAAAYHEIGHVNKIMVSTVTETILNTE